MTVASPEPGRRRRYQRNETDRVIALTAAKLRLLNIVAQYRLISLPQLALLACPSQKAARKHMRELFDDGLVDVVAVPRAALAASADPNDATLLYGSAPNIYTPTREGLKLLHQHGYIDKVPTVRQFGPKNSLFLAHELQVKDVRVWLECCARGREDQGLHRWVDGQDAAIPLSSSPQRVLQPDAWFIYGVGGNVLVGFVEVDRGTERGMNRWQDKLEGYAQLFSTDLLQQVTGYVNARVLVIAPTPARRDAIKALIESCAADALAQRFWLADREVLETADLTQVYWYTPGQRQEKGLVGRDRL